MSIADFGKLNYGWDTTMYLQWTDEKENEREREREGNANHLAFNTHTHTHTQKCTYTYTCNICLEWEHTRTRTFTHRSNYCIPNFKHWCKEHGPYHSHNHTHTHTHTHTHPDLDFMASYLTTQPDVTVCHTSLDMCILSFQSTLAKS